MADEQDRVLPTTLALIYRRESVLQSYSVRGPENARRAADDLGNMQNGRKALEGRLGGLFDPEFFAKLVAKQHDLQAKIAAGNYPEAAVAFGEISRAQHAIAKSASVYNYFQGRGFRRTRGLLKAGYHQLGV